MSSHSGGGLTPMQRFRQLEPSWFVSGQTTSLVASETENEEVRAARGGMLLAKARLRAASGKAGCRTASDRVAEGGVGGAQQSCFGARSGSEPCGGQEDKAMSTDRRGSTMEMFGRSKPLGLGFECGVHGRQATVLVAVSIIIDNRKRGAVRCGRGEGRSSEPCLQAMA